MTQSEKKLPNYQVKIPTAVRFDRQLPAHSKLLYGEISALCNQEGYCWAGNDYFATLYQVQPKVVSRWIQQLRKNGHIQVEISRGNDRKIRLVSNQSDREYTVQLNDANQFNNKP